MTHYTIEKKKVSLKKALIIIFVAAVVLVRNIEYLWANQLLAAVRDGDRREVEEVLDRRLFFSVNRAAGTPFVFRYTAGWWPETALCAACRQGDPDLVRLLLEHGADPDKCTIAYSTPLDETLWPFDVGDDQIIKVLLEYGASADKKSMQMDEALLIDAARVSVFTSDDGETFCYDPETAACKLRVYQMICEAARNKEPLSDAGEPLLIVAAHAEDLELLTYMIEEQDLDINAVDAEGNSALFLDPPTRGMEYLGTEVARYLLDHGIDTTIRNENGQTALEYARACHNEEVRELLEEYEE